MSQLAYANCDNQSKGDIIMQNKKMKNKIVSVLVAVMLCCGVVSMAPAPVDVVLPAEVTAAQLDAGILPVEDIWTMLRSL